VAQREGSTAALPTPKPHKPLPQKHAHMLLVMDHAGRVLLQRRPPTGIWAALWSLPEFDDEDAAQHWASQRLDGADTSGNTSTRALPAIVHGFSHFRLHIQPRLITVNGLRAAIGDNAGLRWATRDELTALGLPAPIRKLLQETNP
jgi:A/G-specific adenine glycosylase